MTILPREQRRYSGQQLRNILSIEADEAQWEALEDLVKRVSGHAGTRMQRETVSYYSAGLRLAMLH